MCDTFDLQTCGLASSFNFYTNKTAKKNDLEAELGYNLIMPIPK